jgi:hypothetical protein
MGTLSQVTVTSEVTVTSISLTDKTIGAYQFYTNGTLIVGTPSTPLLDLAGRRRAVRTS